MTLKQNLLKHVAQAYQMREEEAARDLGLRIAGTTPFPRYGRVPAREERAPMQSLEVWLLKRLMVKPSLAHELPGSFCAARRSSRSRCRSSSRSRGRRQGPTSTRW